MKVERQLKCKGAAKYTSESSSSWRVNWKNEDLAVPKAKTETSRGKGKVSTKKHR